MKIRKVGLRNIKTALSVMVCVILDRLVKILVSAQTPSGSVIYRIFSVFISRNMSVYACIAAVVVMCASISQSRRSALDRISATVLGGAAGVAFIFIRSRLIPLDTVIYPLGVIVLIYFLSLVKKEELVAVTLTVFFITMINSEEEAHIYVLSKVIATVSGALVSLFVNRIIPQRTGEKYEKEK